MRPSEALPKDWRLYYHNTFMEHKTLGVVHVSVVDNSTLRAFPIKSYNKETESLNDAQEVRSEDLFVWFPNRGAYNIGSTDAIYISRRAARQMRKSMNIGDLYYAEDLPRLTAMGMVSILAKKPIYTPADTALLLLRKGKATRRAVSREIILNKPKTSNTPTIEVLFRNNSAGIIRNNELKVDLFYPERPITDFIQKKLNKEGLECASQTL